MHDLEIVYLPPGDLTPYENNARKHAPNDIDAIIASIEKFGFSDPIGIWSDKNIIVEGHGRQIAALQMGLSEVPCIRLDHMTDEQRRGYALAHNKTAELSEWDFSKLDEELKALDSEGFEMSDLGFDMEAIGGGTPQADEDDFDVEPPEEPKAKPGDIYQLGRHRLMCGDSTSIIDIEKLMDGRKADCVVTDPPYNMAYEGAGNTHNRAAHRIMNDNMGRDEFREFLRSVYFTMKQAMRDGASFYVFYKELGEGVFISTLEDAGLKYKQELIWVKSQLVLGGAKYQNMYEPCLFGCKGDRPDTWNGKRNQRSVIESIDLMDENDLRFAIRDLLDTISCDVVREKKQVVNDLHPTMKPVRLLAKLITNSTNADGAVLDLFGGSGSTLIACEQLGRTCYMNELDPKFVDVIISRWEQFTGGKAVLLNG